VEGGFAFPTFWIADFMHQVAWLWMNQAKPLRTLAKSSLLLIDKLEPLARDIRFPLSAHAQYANNAILLAC